MTELTEQWYEKHFDYTEMTEQEKAELQDNIERWYEACLDGRVRYEEGEQMGVQDD